MKPRHSFNILLATALCAAAAITARAQTWTTVYDLPNGVCGEMGTDAVGNVYAAGRDIAPDGSSVATVRGSGNLGLNWSLVDQYAEPGLNYAHNRAFAADFIHGNLFAGGNLNNLLPDGTSQFNTLWFIREWNPATATWSTVDDYNKLANDIGQAGCADILVVSSPGGGSPADGVYAAGGPWVIRKRSPGASSFTTVDPVFSTGAVWDLGVQSSYGVFAVGEMNGIWTVRRSSTGENGTWTTVDSFYAQRDWTGGRALCILTTPSKIHVVGSAYKYRSGTHWVVRSSSDGGQTWAITDDYAPTIPSEARGIVQDASGNLVVCGYVIGSAGGYQWTVRKGTPGTKLVKVGKQWVSVETINWTIIDSFQLAPGKSAQPNGVAIDPSGNIFVGGSATDASGVNHWIVRKLAAQ